MLRAHMSFSYNDNFGLIDERLEFGGIAMKRIFQASSLPDAHLLAGLLARAGIDVHVFNENAHGATGEIPFTHAYPEIWLVDDRDEPAARAIIEEFEKPGSDHGQRVCPACHEINPADFAICWSCQSTLAPDGEDSG